jgi:RNA polymerase sigma factor (sigma-70 family)
MKLLQEDEMSAFEILYDRYRTPLFSYLKRQAGDAVAEDLLQEIFIKIVNGKNSFAFQSSVRTWIWTITRNALTDYYRSAANQHRKMDEEFLSEEGEEVLPSLEESQEEMILKKTSQRQLELCLEELPANQKEAVLLQTQSELSYEEVGAIMKTTTKAIKSLLSRARAGLLDCFKRGGHLE